MFIKRKEMGFFFAQGRQIKCGCVDVYSHFSRDAVFAAVRAINVVLLSRRSYGAKTPFCVREPAALKGELVAGRFSFNEAFIFGRCP